MFKFFDLSYDDLKTMSSHELYKLRKKVFHDRLGWEVNCQRDMEFDEFDNPGTRYILGVCDHQLICSVRFIKLNQPNMITHIFNDCFNGVNLPAIGIESSRFFVDKDASRKKLELRYPVCDALFLAMINFSRYWHIDGIYTIVSHAMLTLLKRSKWQIELIKAAQLSQNENIYLVFLPTGNDSQSNMVNKIQARLNVESSTLLTWPIQLPVKKSV